MKPRTETDFGSSHQYEIDTFLWMALQEKRPELTLELSKCLHDQKAVLYLELQDDEQNQEEVLDSFEESFLEDLNDLERVFFLTEVIEDPPIEEDEKPFVVSNKWKEQGILLGVAE
jgi:uncharacterized protein YfdQ (DUF2303 family)